MAPGERREAQDAGEAGRDAPLSPGFTLSPGLPGWKKSAGRCKTPPLQPPHSPPERRRHTDMQKQDCFVFVRETGLKVLELRLDST